MRRHFAGIGRCSLRSRLGAAAQQRTPFKIGISAPVVTILPVWMARGRRLLRQGRAQGRGHQHGGRHPRRAGAAVRRNPGHARRARGGGAGQQAGRRHPPRQLVVQHPADDDLHQGRDQRWPPSRARPSASAPSARRPTSPSASCSSSTASPGRTSRSRRSAAARSASPRWSPAASTSAPLIEPDHHAWRRSAASIRCIDLAAAKTPWIFDSVVVSRGYLEQNRDTLTELRAGLYRRRPPGALRRDQGEGADRAAIQDPRPERDRRHLRGLQAPDAARRRASVDGARTCWSSCWRSAPTSAART